MHLYRLQNLDSAYLRGGFSNRKPPSKDLRCEGGPRGELKSSIKLFTGWPVKLSRLKCNLNRHTFIGISLQNATQQTTQSWAYQNVYIMWETTDSLSCRAFISVCHLRFFFFNRLIHIIIYYFFFMLGMIKRSSSIVHTIILSSIFFILLSIITLGHHCSNDTYFWKRYVEPNLPMKIRWSLLCWSDYHRLKFKMTKGNSTVRTHFQYHKQLKSKKKQVYPVLFAILHCEKLIKTYQQPCHQSVRFRNVCVFIKFDHVVFVLSISFLAGNVSCILAHCPHCSCVLHWT